MVLDVKLAIVGEESVACEVLLLPLLHTRGTIDRILGSFSPLETPSWLAATPVSAKYLIANELIWPSHDPRAALTRPLPALEPDVMRERTARIVRSERRQFRVVEGGRSGSEIDES